MKKRTTNDWIIVIALIIIVVFLLWANSSPNTTLSKEEKLQLKKDALLREKDILNNDLNEIQKLEDQLRKQGVKIWQRLLRFLILAYLGCNLFFYFIIPNNTIMDVIQWNTVIVLLINIPFLFFGSKLFSLKKFLLEDLKEYSYKKLVGSSDAQYFGSKKEEIQNRLEQIELELSQLNNIG